MIRPTVVTLLTATIGFAALSISSPASADDQKTFSTMACVPNGPPSSEDTNLSYSFLGLLNTSVSDNLVVTCPLTKDAEHDAFQDPFGDVAFSYAISSGKSGQVNCTVQVGFLQDGLAYFSASSNEPIRPAGYQASGVHLPMEVTSNYLAPINLVCSLSPRTRLTRIWITEDQETDNAY